MRVLVPVDGSALSWAALRFALERFPEAAVTVLHVVDLFEPGDLEGTGGATYEPFIGSDAWYQRADERGDRLLAEAEQVAADRDRAVETAATIGDPERVVVDYAAEEPVDHVVVGAHGRTDADRELFGSTAATVVRRATVPVTVVR